MATKGEPVTADDPIRARLDFLVMDTTAEAILADAIRAVVDLAWELGTDYAHSDFTGEYVEAEVRRVIATALGVDT